MKVSPSRALFTSATLPVKVMVASAVPSPVLNARPAHAANGEPERPALGAQVETGAQGGDGFFAVGRDGLQQHRHARVSA